MASCTKAILPNSNESRFGAGVAQPGNAPDSRSGSPTESMGSNPIPGAMFWSWSKV